MAKVLIVDDEQEVARALKRLLRGEHEVRIAGSPAEALTEAEGFLPDLVITDYQMPGMNGEALLVQVRLKQPELPGIILSGFHPSSRRANPGLNIFMEKPWNDVELPKLINKLLSQPPAIVH